MFGRFDYGHNIYLEIKKKYMTVNFISKWVEDAEPWDVCPRNCKIGLMTNDSEDFGSSRCKGSDFILTFLKIALIKVQKWVRTISNSELLLFEEVISWRLCGALLVSGYSTKTDKYI